MDFISNVGNEFVRQGKAGVEYAGDAYDAYMKYVGEPFFLTKTLSLSSPNLVEANHRAPSSKFV